MKTEPKKETSANDQEFHTVEFFREIKRKLAERMVSMTLAEQKEFLKALREGKIKIA